MRDYYSDSSKATLAHRTERTFQHNLVFRSGAESGQEYIKAEHATWNVSPEVKHSLKRRYYRLCRKPDIVWNCGKEREEMMSCLTTCSTEISDKTYFRYTGS